jgi:hypothetical protein
MLTKHNSQISKNIADEMVEAYTEGIGIDQYCELILAGADHEEILKVRRLCTGAVGPDGATALFRTYTTLRKSGASHDEWLDALNRRWPLWHYSQAREAGATHAECLEVENKGLMTYSVARQYGATHAECLEVVFSCCSWSSYAFALSVGASHQECLEVHRAGGHFDDYGSARVNGATHAECLEAVVQCADFRMYVVCRQDSSHESALAACR